MKNRFKPIVFLYHCANRLSPVPRFPLSGMGGLIDYSFLVKKNNDLKYVRENPVLIHAIRRAVDFLSFSQLPSGEFAILEGHRPDLSDGVRDSTPFIASFVIHSLDFVHDSRIPRMQDRALRFILENKEPHDWTWRYWSKNNWKYGRLLRADVDDTCINLVSLLKNGIREGTNTAYLPPQNQNGSFCTWIGTRLDGWPPFQTVDGVVNANIAYQLILAQKENKKLDHYLVSLLDESALHRVLRHYPAWESFYYAYSRGLALKKDPQSRTILNRMKQYILSRYSKTGLSSTSAFRIALALNALIQCGASDHEIEPFVQFLINSQSLNGSWEAGSFYVGLSPYYGSRELTTALVAEAFGKHLLGLYSSTE